MVYGCCFWGESYDLHGIFCPTFPLVFLRFLAFWGVPPKKGCFWGGGGGGGAGGGGGGGCFCTFFPILIQKFEKTRGMHRISGILYLRGEISILIGNFVSKSLFGGVFTP